MKTFLIYSIVDYIVNSCCHEINRKFNEFCIQNSQIVLQPDCFYEKIKSKYTYTNCYVDREVLSANGLVYGYIITYKKMDNIWHHNSEEWTTQVDFEEWTTQFIKLSNIKYARKKLLSK